MKQKKNSAKMHQENKVYKTSLCILNFIFIYVYVCTYVCRCPQRLGGGIENSMELEYRQL